MFSSIEMAKDTLKSQSCKGRLKSQVKYHGSYGDPFSTNRQALWRESHRDVPSYVGGAFDSGNLRGNEHIVKKHLNANISSTEWHGLTTGLPTGC